MNFDSKTFRNLKHSLFWKNKAVQGKLFWTPFPSASSEKLFEEGKTSEIHSLDKTSPATAELSFTCSGVNYKVSWKAVPSAGGYSIYRELRNENNEIVDDNLQNGLRTLYLLF